MRLAAFSAVFFDITKTEVFEEICKAAEIAFRDETEIFPKLSDSRATRVFLRSLVLSIYEKGEIKRISEKE